MPALIAAMIGQPVVRALVGAHHLVGIALGMSGPGDRESDRGKACRVTETPADHAFSSSVANRRTGVTTPRLFPASRLGSSVIFGGASAGQGYRTPSMRSWAF